MSSSFVKKSVWFVPKVKWIIHCSLGFDFVLGDTSLELCRFLVKLFKSQTGTRKDIGMTQIAIRMHDCMHGDSKRIAGNKQETNHSKNQALFESEVPSLSLPVIPLAIVSVDYVTHSLKTILVCLNGLFEEHLIITLSPRCTHIRLLLHSLYLM